MTHSPDQHISYTNLTERLMLAAALAAALALTACTSGISSSSRQEAASATPLPSASASATPEQPSRVIPEVAGKDLNLAWPTVTNRALFKEMMREGERLPGDASANDDDDPKYWTMAVVLGVPVSEVAHEDVINIASIDPSADDGEITFAMLPKDQLPIGKANKDGRQIDVYMVRVRLGEQASLASFVSGDIDESEHDPSWAAESTLKLDITTIDDKKWAAVPIA